MYSTLLSVRVELCYMQLHVGPNVYANEFGTGYMYDIAIANGGGAFGGSGHIILLSFQPKFVV